MQTSHIPIPTEQEAQADIRMTKDYVDTEEGSRKEDDNGHTYKCNLCEFRADSVDLIWKHKLDKHTGESFNFNKMDKNSRKNILFNILAEQNVEIIEEVVNLRNSMKEIFKQMLNDFEDGMQDVVKNARKHNTKTTMALSDLRKEINDLNTAKRSPPRKAKETSESQTEKSSSSIPLKTASPPQKSELNKEASNTKPKSKPISEYQRKPKILVVGDSVAHNANFRFVEEVTHSTIKTSKAYSSGWDTNARFKHLNVTDVAAKELKKSTFDHLVLAAPTVDITNLNASKMKPEDTTEALKQKVEESCQNMLKTAENALANNTGLRKVIIMNHAPRFDTGKVDPIGLKPKLAMYANSFLLELWLDSPQKDNILIGSHNLECSPRQKMDRYTDVQSGHYDGVHMYGESGKTAYTESVLNILLSSIKPSSPSSHRQARHQLSDDSHTSCPQTKYNRKQKRQYSSVVAGNGPTKTQNRFSSLGESSGN